MPRLIAARPAADAPGMAVSRAVLGLIALLAVLATLWMTMLSSGGGAGVQAGSSNPVAPGASPAPGAYGNATNAAQNAVQQANGDGQRAAQTAAGGTP